ncbi:hypothetical protein TEA_008935 [Camellia sinensis var. sinensis]|uniref:DOG1 domain-containing protein n=1 Tax=Camellia sinensis var. sinensis TaxID=542762 RepID=A0A4S4EHE8_CAMSN|nr:hypothetical protein TEA_008935 [Camellia sinensis var. sinensis]
MSRKASSGHYHQAFDQKHPHQIPQPQQHQQQHQQSEMENDLSQTQVTQSSPKPIPEKRKGAGSSSEKVLDAKIQAFKMKICEMVTDIETFGSKQRGSKEKPAEKEGGGGSCGTISPGAAMFDLEYGRWLDDDHRHMSELRTGLQAHLQDSDLRIIVDGYIAHYDEIFQLKGVAAKSDVFHLITGMWTTPAERCFLWMGGFRPSELIKMLITQLDPLTEQQVMNIYSLQHSSQQAEEALSQGLEQLQQSLIETIASGSINDGMHHMAVALGKLTNLEGFIRQADNLRQQTLHQLRRILTVRQAARCFLVIGEYYGRLRALSSLWSSRPRETLIISDDNSCQTTTDLQMVMQCSQNQFSNF